MRHTLNKLKILVLGGSGFIGTAVISELLLSGHQVVATYCNHKPIHKDSLSLSWISWNASNKSLPDVDWREINAVLHIANYSDPSDFPYKSKPIYQINLESVFGLLEKARLNNIARVIIASTGDVLSNKIKIATEQDVNYAPRSFYAATKACAELITNAYSNVVSTAILRFFHPYGLGGDRFLINRLVTAVRESEEIPIEGKEGIVISPVYLNDVVRGTILTLESTATGIFHLSGPDIISLRSFLELVGKLVGRKPIIKFISKQPPGGHAALYARAKEILGYTPSITIKQGVNNLLNLP